MIESSFIFVVVVVVYYHCRGKQYHDDPCVVHLLSLEGPDCYPVYVCVVFLVVITAAALVSSYKSDARWGVVFLPLSVPFVLRCVLR